MIVLTDLARESLRQLVGDLADRVVVVSHGIPPVSYTHLRAHETVLDLVCRLLLEKKKYLTPIEIVAVSSHPT